MFLHLMMMRPMCCARVLRVKRCGGASRGGTRTRLCRPLLFIYFCLNLVVCV